MFYKAKILSRIPFYFLKRGLKNVIFIILFLFKIQNELLKRGLTVKSFQTMRQEGKGFFRIVSYVVIAAFIISIFIIGSLTGMLGGDNQAFITLEGREVIDRFVKKELDDKLQGQESAQKSWILFQNVQPHLNKLVFLIENQAQKLEPSLLALSGVLKEKYQEMQEAYRKENMEYPYPYVNFLEMNKEGYMVELLHHHIKTIPIVDDLSVAKEYMANNTFSEVDFVYFSFDDYLKTLNVPQEKMQEAYQKNKELFLNSISVKMAPFKDLLQAEEALNKVRIGDDSLIANNLSNKTFKSGEIDDFFKLKAAQEGNYADPILYKNQYWIAFIEKMNYLDLDKLSVQEKNKLKEQALEDNRDEFFNQFKDWANQVFENNPNSLKEAQRQKIAKIGTTAPFSMASFESAKDAKTGKPLEPIFTSQNKEFFTHAFSKEKTLSPVLMWENFAYKIQVKKITLATYPIPEKTKDEIKKSLNEREGRKMEQEYISFLRDVYPTKYHWDNLDKLFGLKGDS